MKSWQTTLAGVLTAVSMLCHEGNALLDADPTTNPSLTAIFAAFGMLGLGFFARDNSKTSENVGAK